MKAKTTPSEHNRLRLVELLFTMTTGEGLRPSVLDGVKLSRADRDYARSPVMYEPSIFIVASGRKCGYFGERRIIYDPNNYLVLALPMAFECQTLVGKRGEPMLGISIRIDMGTLSELALNIEGKKPAKQLYENNVVGSTPFDSGMSDAVIRLLQAMQLPRDAKVLAPGIIREVVYRVLCGPRGEALLALLSRHAPLSQLQSALQKIHVDYAEPLEVTALSEEAGMSVSSFHHTFKAVTSTSPLQYLKQVRLHKARMLMVHDGLRATVAAHAVGYESPSQFSREFKRFFGRTPLGETERVRLMLGLEAHEETVVP